MKVTPARNAAFEILNRIETGAAHSSALLPIHEARLSPADGRLCHELTLGTLRRQIYLDRIIDLFSGGKRLDVEVRVVLRLAIYQLYFLDRVPDHAAINESVNLVQLARKTSAKGFVNAVLRRASRERPALRYVDVEDRISVETSHPRWLIEKWISDFGIERAESLAVSNNTNPEVTFRLLNGTINDIELAGIKAEESDKIRGCYVAHCSGDRLQELVHQGQIYIQDAASQMVANSIEIPRGGKFLDVCAAPGGKTGSIALGHDDASLIAAGDIHSYRVRLLAGNLHRHGAVKAAVIQYDAVEGLPFAEKSLDCLLVDAPCSGTGTIRRNPEIRYHLVPTDFQELQKKQLAILRGASKLVKPAGCIVYSTCSLEPEENETVCTHFEAASVEFDRIIPNLPARFVKDGGFARTWPDKDAIDGFFVAAYRRRS